MYNYVYFRSLPLKTSSNIFYHKKKFEGGHVLLSCLYGGWEMLSFTIFPGPMKNTPENCRIKGQAVILADIHVDSLLL